ncbi:hypothetical protein [Actinomycetospora sp. TBRC 11914]|uniref:hypothetical protein n=1 Tax=Actinomycetospora sp. TBRC 11914 TaxID=2729387 RepID=UPI00145F370F|nr:hypothetical protein [Actinomycetospora sp. TBRC 11914]NMO90055.1 hypothetical protein [Actinomycetospora sp. TBRC 11914]
MDAAEHTPTVVRPRLPRAEFADALAAWLEEGLAARGDGASPVGAAVVLVPEYLHAGAPRVLADLAARDWTGTVVAVVGYGGCTRGRHAIEDAREVLRAAGAEVLGEALGIDAARVRATGFDAADVLLREALLGALRAREQKLPL